jgi:hypothetical protein
VVSLLCYFLCAITVLTTVTGAMIGLFISRSERMGHYPRPVVESNVTATNREQRLFMVVPETHHGSHAKIIQTSSATVSNGKANGRKSKPQKYKLLARHDVHGNTPRHPEEPPNGPSSLFSTVTQIGGNL